MLVAQIKNLVILVHSPTHMQLMKISHRHTPAHGHAPPPQPLYN
jgi:hypothetical protein